MKSLDLQNWMLKEPIIEEDHSGSQNFSALLLEQLQIAIILIDRNFRVINYNCKLEEITGISFKSFLGKSITKAINLKNLRGTRIDVRRIFNSIIKQPSGTVHNFKCQYSHPSDKVLWFSASIIPIHGYSGVINQIALCLQDITQSHEIESFLKELEVRYETVFNSVNDGIFLYEPIDFKLIDVNDRVVEMYGFSKSELKELKIEELSVKEEGYSNLRGFLYALRAIRGNDQVYEWHARNKSGHTFWTRLLLKKVMIGGTSYLMGIIKDIENQKKAELSLRESEEHYRALAQNSPDVIMRFDRFFKHLYVNDSVRKIVPVDPKEFLNKTHKEMGIFEPEMCDVWEKHINSVFMTGKSSEIEFSIDLSGKRTFIEWRLFPEYNSKGKISTVLAVARDITEKKESQQVLRNNEERLQMALEVSSDGMWDWDLSNEQIYFSPRYFTMLGYEPDEFEHKLETLYALMHPEDRNRVIKAYDPQAMIENDGLDIEVRMRRKDGSFAWILTRGKVFAKNKEGFPIRMVGTNIDISQRKRQEDIRNVLIEISESVNKTRTLDEFFEQMQVLLGKVIDTKNCYVALYDKKTHSITLPFHRDEKDKFKVFPAGKTITSYVIRSGKSQLLDAKKIKELTATGEIEIIGAPSVSWLGVPLRIENELIGVFVVQSYEESVSYDEDDVQILEFVSDQIALAISRKKVQERILEDQERQRQIIESSPDGLIVTSKEGVILDYNSRIIDMLDCRSKNLKNRNLEEFVHSAFVKKLPEIYQGTLKSGFHKQEEIRMRRENQKEFFAEISFGLIQSANDKPEIFVITIKDIDERKAYETNLEIAKEKAEESDRLKTAFLSNMSHEIRTPMNAIIGFSELLSRGGITEEEKQEFISQINFGAESLMRLIDDIIDIAKIEAGQIKIYNSYFDLSTLLKDLKLLFSRNLYRQNRQNLQLIEDNNDISVSIQFYGDQIRIRQILNNLLSNAIKFTEKGEIRFGVRSISDGFISFYVKDTGAGIAEEKLQIIFDRFRQGHESKTKFYGGTGLGLAISKHLVELMGGTINVSSVKEEGSEFVFSIPFYTMEGDIVETVKAFEKKENNWEGKTILIAEDDASNYFLLQEILKSTFVKILWAKDGNEVVEMFKSKPEIDLILMDVQLPVLDGYSASRIIKNLRSDIPIIAQTSYAMSGEKQESILAGCDEYISKPIKIEDLLSIISKFLTN